METSTNKFKIIHKTLQKADNRLSVKMLCEIAGVSPIRLLQLGSFGRKESRKRSTGQS